MAGRTRAAIATGLVLMALTWMSLQAQLFYKPLPVIDGYYRFLGLDERAEVVRDSFGIPRIEAGTLHDLFFLQGYVTAQDRFTQMEEVRERSRSMFTHMPAPLDQAAIAAAEVYARGVSKYIEQHAAARALPAEITLRGRDPDPWTRDDVLRIEEYLRGRSSVMCRVVSGDAARRGAPLLSAQAETFTPGLGWYEIGLRGPGVNALGISLPGVPGIVAGHNGAVAWAIDGLDVSGVLSAARALSVADIPERQGCFADIRGDTQGAEEEGADLDVEAVRLRFAPTAAEAQAARIIVDLGDLDGSRAALSSGQSGHAVAFHYRDQAQLWSAGQLHRLAWTEAAIARMEGRLVLRPR